MEWLAGSSVRLSNVGGGLVSALLVLAFIVLCALGVRQALRVQVATRRWSLLAMRLSTASAALLFALQPQCVAERVQNVQGRLVVLLDASRSMSVRDGGTSRAEREHELLERWGGDRDAPFDLYTFGRDAAPANAADLNAEQLASEDDTRIQRALERVAGDLGEDLGAVVLVSDGADLSPGWSPAQLRELGVRVHAVSFEAAADVRDDGISSAEADPVAFLRQRAEIAVTVRSTGGDRQPLVISLRQDGQVVSQATAEIDDKGVGKAVLPFTPSRIGRAVYSVSIPVAEKDAVPENNERAVLVRVTRDKLRVLLLCGAPTWDTRFLRAFLKADPATDLITFFILRTSSDLTMASPEELSLIPFPTDELFREHLDSFDVVIFQDFNYAPYQVAAYLPRIRDYVLRGGAFAMIGGSRAFGAGGYERTPIADILPVDMVPGAKSLLEEEFQAVVAKETARHPIVELVPDPVQNLKTWSELAKLVGANEMTGVRDGAQALLVHPDQRAAQGAPMPVLAVGSAGQGRTLALAADSTWRWGITTAGQRGDASAYERFWDRALRWLARDPLLDPAHVETDRERYGPGARMQARMRLRDARYEPLAERALELLVLDKSGEKQSMQSIKSDAAGAASAELKTPLQPGAYRIAVRDPQSDELIAEQGFAVEIGGDELADPRPRPDLMAEIARTTGGSFYTHERAPDLDAFDRTRTRALGTDVTEPFTSPWFFALLVALFGVEWVLRRAWGLR